MGLWCCRWRRGTSEFLYTKDIIPQEVFDAIEEAKQKIISGEIVVTNPLQ